MVASLKALENIILIVVFDCVYVRVTCTAPGRKHRFASILLRLMSDPSRGRFFTSKTAMHEICICNQMFMLPNLKSGPVSTMRRFSRGVCVRLGATGPLFKFGNINIWLHMHMSGVVILLVKKHPV
jgi:hypothetical protein